MGTLKFRYTATEALEMMKEHFPKDYQEKINVGKALIVRLKKLYKKPTYQEAYQKYISANCRVESAIMMLCALEELIQEEKQAKMEFNNTVYGIIQQQDAIILQQQHLETDKNIEEIDRRMLRAYYRRKLDELNTQLDQLTQSIEVNEPEFVVIQHSLLGQPGFTQP